MNNLHAWVDTIRFMEITLHAAVGFFAYAIPHNDSPTIITKIYLKSTGDTEGYTHHATRGTRNAQRFTLQTTRR
jgi:hypothetical protein